MRSLIKEGTAAAIARQGRLAYISGVAYRTSPHKFKGPAAALLAKAVAYVIYIA